MSLRNFLLKTTLATGKKLSSRGPSNAAQLAPGKRNPSRESVPAIQRAARFVRGNLEWLADKDLPTFHRYAFATLRQCGAAFELAALYLRWLTEHGEYPGWTFPADAFMTIAVDAKAHDV